MEKVLTKGEVQAQLRGKSEEISLRLDALGGELATTGDALRDAVFLHPLVGVGSAIAGGLLVGLLFGGRKKKKRAQRLKGAHRELVDRYIEAVAEDARHAVGRGREPGEAVRRALADRTPLVIYAPAGAQEQTSLLRDALDLIFKTAIAFVVKSGIDFVTARMDLDALGEFLEEAARTEGPAEGAEAVAAATDTEFGGT